MWCCEDIDEGVGVVEDIMEGLIVVGVGEERVVGRYGVKFFCC